MNQINNNKPFSEKLDHKHRNKSELVFYKLMAKQKAMKNPFDEIRSTTYASSTEQKPGGNPNDPD